MRSLLTLFTAILVVALCQMSMVLPSFAQAGRIAGTVTDAQTGDELPGANVLIQGTSRGAATDVEGTYTITGVPAGTHTIVVSYIGYDRLTREITVGAGETVQADFELQWEGVTGEEIVITAQAAGQTSAINQQLASNTITNIVSRDRIQELPDVNAAESIGRLPGVSIQRSGGEANRVAIRGLSPKYNTVTVNGVRMPATGGDDRAVDLNLVSSNMLDGIEVTKAITPDMDADAIGGSIDLRLRQAPAGLLVDVQAQGGYNQLQDYYGNYKFAGTVSNRFLDDRLGIIATANVDDYDRSADKMSTNHQLWTIPGTDDRDIRVSAFSGREERVDRGRTGASLVTDYRIPFGRLTGNAFYNRLTNEGVNRVNNYFDAGTTRMYYNMNLFDNQTSILTSAIGVEQDFAWLQYDFTASRTTSRSYNPENFNFSFSQEGAALDTDALGEVEPGMRPPQILPYITPDSSFTGLADMNVQSIDRDEDQYSLQGNVQVPFRLGRYVDGHVKTGGKLRWLDRVNDETQFGQSGLQYGVGAGSAAVVQMRCAEELMPERFQDVPFADTAIDHGLLPISIFDDGYDRANFLEGEFPLGYTADPEMAREFAMAMSQCGQGFLENVIASRGRDYTGEERYQAAYLMTEINLGRYVTFTPGFRWEGDQTTYTGQQFREVVRNNQQAEPTDLAVLVSERSNSFFLPMVHLRVRPTSWLQLHLARTETISRPDFIQYVPITRISSMQDYAFAGNTELRPSHTTNYDASMSIFERRVGLFTLSAFNKTMSDHIRWVRLYTVNETPPLGLNIPESWLVSNPVVDTYVNNPFDATYQGFELDWQTNFWYLPSVLKGLVLNLNYTRILSDTRYQSFDTEEVCVNCPTRRPQYETVVTEFVREGRMIDQPAHIANVTVGYDFRGFSTRLSYLYQTDRLTSIHMTEPVMDTFSGAYSRYDLMVRQKVGRGLEMFANLNNLTSTPDRNFQSSPTGAETFVEYYGFTMDIGARYRF